FHQDQPPLERFQIGRIHHAPDTGRAALVRGGPWRLSPIPQRPFPYRKSSGAGAPAAASTFRRRPLLVLLDLGGDRREHRGRGGDAGGIASTVVTSHCPLSC